MALFMLAPLLAACAGGNTVLASDISKELICQCGCAEVVNTCDCSTAAEMITLIKQDLAQGQSKQQILQSFIDQYGEQVLAPRAHLQSGAD